MHNEEMKQKLDSTISAFEKDCWKLFERAIWVKPYWKKYLNRSASAVDFKDGGHENSMKENNKLISINFSLISCRESNNHNVLIPTNTKFVKSSDIS